MTVLPLAVTMGEPAGIGGELTLKAWAERSADLPPFFAIDDPTRLAGLNDRLGLGVPIQVIGGPEETAAVFPRALPVLPLALRKPAVPGRLDAANAPAVIEAIDRAVALASGGRAAAVVTHPIHKKVLMDSGFRHPGHTEYLASLAGDGFEAVMMLTCPGLRVVPLTVHLPLARVAAGLDRGAVERTGRIILAALRRDFGVAAPRLAVAGLNPHAGEGGALGREEIEIIAPAVATLRGEGHDVRDPAPADSLFHAEARARYDAVLCMYHDQALIPLKTIDFAGGVNVTLGLPFVRTSPDHGTALDIAGRGVAFATSFVAALHQAAAIAARRRAHA
ncbi:MAG: 4-hydroxythreonine-4-phosphate dehydrogenase PdxA [Alphaproteobacteria bacterium]|nr:4-hydroxythreonine-4-phosphate dehydrogenase PdxA [Alphaproteobacteria bacterium]